MNRRFSWLEVIGLVLLCPLLALGQDEAKPTQTDEAPETRPQRWEFGTSIRAAGGPCSGLFGTFPVPTEWPEQEVKIAEEQITPNVQRHSFRAADGLKQMVFEVPQLANGETATCYVTFEIIKRPIKPPSDPSRLVIPKNVPVDLRKFLGNSPLIEVNARARSLAKEWTEGKETAWEQVEALCKGLREKVTYERDPKNNLKGAAGALRDGKADKEDMTAAFVAVCRASRIPARMVWPLDYCYAEFYLEEKPAEEAPVEGKPAKVTKEKPKGAWYACVVHEEATLGEVKDLHPILEKGDNFKVPEDKASQRLVAEFLTGKGGGGKPSVERRRRQAD